MRNDARGPHGFTPHASGLLVPDELARERETWTYQDWRILERATQLLKRHEVTVFLRCDRKECQATKMERLRRPDGGITLRCNHLDREFTRF